MTHHGTKGRYLPGKGFVAMRSDLDFRAIDKDGRCAFFDAKTYREASVLLSRLPMRQRALAEQYEERNLVAGFLIEFRASGKVCFIRPDAWRVTRRGARLDEGHGIACGTSSSLDLLPIFSAAQKER